MPILQLTNDELRQLALVAHERNDSRVTPQFRLRILEAALRGGDPQGLAFAAQELWLLDDLLILPDPRSAKTPNGKPVLDLLEKVWTLLVEVHYARQDSTGHADPDPHPAPDRPRRGAGARTDLPPTKAGSGPGRALGDDPQPIGG